MEMVEDEENVLEMVMEPELIVMVQRGRTKGGIERTLVGLTC